MFNNKIARSVLMLLAVSAFAACSSNSDSGGSNQLAPATETASVTEVTQKASVKIATVTDAEGRDVAIESSTVLGQLAQADRAEVRRVIGAEGMHMEIDLRNEAGSIALFHANGEMTEVAAVTGFPATKVEVALVEGRVAQMTIALTENERALNVVLAFGAEQDQSQDCAKQDSGKQGDVVCEEPKKDEPKQDEPKQDEPKQDEPKQDEPKKDEPKQDEPKKDEPKQDEPKKDEPKQDEPKKDEPKQDEPKKDEPKQDDKKKG